MSAFEFAFSLFGLVLGLALAEAMGGFVRVLKARTAPGADVAIRLGWLTPLLASVVVLDLISFWLAAWFARDEIPITYAAFIFAAAMAGIYYAAAALVFPDVPQDWPDLDDWFDRHKAQVAGGIFAAGLLLVVGEQIARPALPLFSATNTVQLVYVALAAALIFARKRWQDGLLLILLLAILGWYAALPFLYDVTESPAGTVLN